MLVWLGWVFDVTTLQRIFSGWPKVAPITMLTLLLGGASIWSLASAQSNPVEGRKRAMARLVSQISSGLVAMIGLCKLGSWLFAWDLPFDLLGFREALAFGETPARMAPATALEFLLIGSALFLVGRSWTGRVSQGLTLGAGVIGWLGIARYLYGEETLLPYSQMSAITALCCLLLSGGALCLQSKGGLMTLLLSDGTGGLLMRRLLPATLLVPVLVGWLQMKALQSGRMKLEYAQEVFVTTDIVLLAGFIWILAALLERVDAKRREAEKTSVQLAAIVKSSDDAIIGKDLDGIITSWNTGAERIFGFSAEEMQGASILRLLPPDRRLEGQQILEKIRRGESVQHFETVRLAKDGHLIQVSLTSSPIRDADGKIIGASKLVRDISEQKRRELQLKDYGNEIGHLKAALDEHAIVAITNPQGKITHVNDKFCNLSKYSREELMGQDHRLINSGLHSKEFIRDLWATITQGRVWKGEIRNRAKDGSFYWVDTTIVPFLNVEGKAAQYVAIRADITERKRAEAAIKESLHEKETLLKEIHHRVKNNLQLVSSLLQLQSGYIRDPDALAVFTESQSRIRSMALIHEKLYQSPSLACIDFAEYVRGLVALLLRTYNPRTDAIAVELRIEAIALNLDTAIPFGLILNELISNSFKHAFPAPRGGLIQVTLTPALGDTFELTVRDNGVGLPPGFDWTQSPSLGWRLIRILTDQIQGRLQVQSQRGVEYRLTFAELKTKDKQPT